MFDVDTIELAAGKHEPGSGQASFMEAVSYFAGEAWSDHPECVSPLIAIFGRKWNDALPDTDRTRLLRPYIRRVAGTRRAVDLSELGLLGAFTSEEGMKNVAGIAADSARAWICADWLIRTYAVAWLRLAGRDTTVLEELPELAAGMHGYHHVPGVPPCTLIMRAIVPDIHQAKPRLTWWGFHSGVSHAEALTGGRAVWDAFKAVPWLAPDAPDSQIHHTVMVAVMNAQTAMKTVIQAAARDAGWNDALEVERLVTLDMAHAAASRARREIEQTAPAEARRAALDARRAAERHDRHRRKVTDRSTRRNAEATARRTAGRAIGPYIWMRAKAAGWAAVRDSRKVMGQYAPPAIRDAARAAGWRAYRDVERTAHWQPALAAAEAAAQRSLAPTIAELQSSACDLLDRLITA
ncbi:hypothetical protein [Streptomyces flaveus]|uniref:hypothetical protein n=1 Tax=Streptomyces flaveus TaxID=66370 RepID=UPI00331FD32D